LIFQYNAYQKSWFVNVARNISGNIYKKTQGIQEYMHLKEINDILVFENARLRSELNKESSERFPAAYDSTLHHQDSLASAQTFFYIPSKVINNSTNKQFNYITINKGTLQGVNADMAVISEQGVVGVVIDASEDFASVIPVINNNFRLSAKLKRNDQFGILEWNGLDPQHINLKEIPTHIDVFEGDTIVTSGYSAIFPEGILIGKVEELTAREGNFYQIKVKLFTDFGKLFHVNVISNFYREEQKKLEGEVGYD